jgi:DNA gyrase/topoisomerase IV subunit B
MENNFLEFIEIESIEEIGYENVVDISVTGDSSFILSNGIISHNSALSAVRKFRDTQMFGAFPLRGKFMNVTDTPKSRIMGNKEVKDLMASLGLKFGQIPFNLRYGKIYIYTDADPDGDAISASLINFFATFWPDLFDQNRIFKVMTPLVVIKKKNKKINFFTNEEYENWLKEEKNIKTWNIEYKKGLASLEDDEYVEIIKSPNVILIEKDVHYLETLAGWFGKDVMERKEKILGHAIENENSLF